MGLLVSQYLSGSSSAPALLVQLPSPRQTYSRFNYTFSFSKLYFCRSSSSSLVLKHNVISLLPHGGPFKESLSSKKHFPSIFTCALPGWFPFLNVTMYLVGMPSQSTQPRHLWLPLVLPVILLSEVSLFPLSL